MGTRPIFYLRHVWWFSMLSTVYTCSVNSFYHFAIKINQNYGPCIFGMFGRRDNILKRYDFSSNKSEIGVLGY